MYRKPEGFCLSCLLPQINVDIKIQIEIKKNIVSIVIIEEAEQEQVMPD